MSRKLNVKDELDSDAESYLQEPSKMIETVFQTNPCFLSSGHIQLDNMLEVTLIGWVHWYSKAQDWSHRDHEPAGPKILSQGWGEEDFLWSSDDLLHQR